MGRGGKEGGGVGEEPFLSLLFTVKFNIEDPTWRILVGLVSVMLQTEALYMFAHKG